MQKNKHLWKEYYQKILSKPHRIQTAIAEAFNSSGNYIAVDCGCGTGADTLFLAQKGYEVHAFDMNEESVKICKERFSDKPKVNVSQRSFLNFRYPESGIVLANASLFFCEPKNFNDVWSKINKAIPQGGVFCGDFMGTKDSWINDPETTVCPLTEKQVKDLFSGYKIEQFKEQDGEGTTALGITKYWHTYQVIAKKCT